MIQYFYALMRVGTLSFCPFNEILIDIAVMNVELFDESQYQSKAAAKKALIKLLQDAHAGEKAAANAYWGHGHSFFLRNNQEKKEILNIYREELHHRSRLKILLEQLGNEPRRFREIGMWLVGATIAILSYFGTWIIPMYGAGRLESANIGEYEVAARLAYLCGENQIVSELLSFAEVEWDHEDFFRKKAMTHPLVRWVPLWPESKSREAIRSSFSKFTLATPELP